MTLEDWIAKNARDLHEEIETHIRIFADDPKQHERLLRTIFVSIKEWVGEQRR